MIIMIRDLEKASLLYYDLTNFPFLIMSRRKCCNATLCIFHYFWKDHICTRRWGSIDAAIISYHRFWRQQRQAHPPYHTQSSWPSRQPSKAWRYRPLGTLQRSRSCFSLHKPILRVWKWKKKKKKTKNISNAFFPMYMKMRKKILRNLLQSQRPPFHIVLLTL